MGVTPIYGFPYPEITDPVDPATFCTLADLIDAELQRFADELVFAKDRPYASAIATFAATYTVAVETQLTWTLLVDNDSMFNAGTPDRFTIQTPGIYMATLWEADVGNYTTLTSARFAIYQGGLVRYGERKSRNNGSNSLATSANGLLRCDTVGETVDVRVLWNGTGGPGRVTSARFALRRVASVI